MGNHELTPIPSYELASRVIVNWHIIHTNHQKQPADHTEHIAGLSVADPVSGICLDLNAPEATPEQEAAFALPA